METEPMQPTPPRADDITDAATKVGGESGTAAQNAEGVRSSEWLAALARALRAESETLRNLEDQCAHPDDKARARLRSCLMGDIARAMDRAASQ
jgi:hypothetical protein